MSVGQDPAKKVAVYKVLSESGCNDEPFELESLGRLRLSFSAPNHAALATTAPIPGFFWAQAVASFMPPAVEDPANLLSEN